MSGAPTAFGLGAVLGLSGIGFDSPSLTVAGVGLLVLAVVAVVWVELARPRLLLREPGPARVVEDQPYPVRIEAVGARVPPPGGQLDDSALEAPVEIGPRWNGRLERQVELRGRGRRRLDGARLEIRDPLGLWRRTVRGEELGELLVLPRVEPVVVAGRGAGGARLGSLGGLDDGAAANRLDPRAIELEVDGLRAYREGSPASRIHWPAVARTGELVERRLVSGSDAAPLVVLDAAHPADEESFEAAVRAAGSLCVRLAGAGGCAALLPGTRRPVEIDPDLSSWPQVHAKLALVEAGATGAPVSRAIRSGAVFWVTAARHPGLPRVLSAGGTAPRYLVAPASGRPGAAFTVAGCEGVLAGSAARRAMGRVA